MQKRARLYGIGNIMEFELIELFPEDDIVSACDRLAWANEKRVLFALPDDGRLLTKGVDLARLRRRADTLRLEVGLLTKDSRIRSQAQPLGFPVFRSIEQAEDNERQWRRGRRRREKAGMSPAEIRDTFLSAADRREVQRRQQERAAWQQWLWRYATIFLFFMTLAVFYVAVVYAVPGATIELRPYTEPLQVAKEIVADPQLETVNFGGSSVPARVLVVSTSWQTEVATTGSIDVADAPARGQVVFANTTEETITIPAGTIVRTSTGQSISFQTVQAVTIAGIDGATVQADIVAVNPGPAGNILANQINEIEGVLGFQLEVRNLTPTTGGGIRSVAAVSEADVTRLRGQVTQYLQTLAQGQIDAQLQESEFLAQDSLRIIRIEEETLSHFVGEQTDTVSLSLRAEVQGTAVDTNQATDLVYNELVSAVESQYVLIPDQLNFYSGRVLGVDGDGRVSFEMIGEGIMAAEISTDHLLEDVAGQQISHGMAYLFEQLPLAEPPRATVTPNWFDRLPYLSARIQPIIVVE